MRITFDTLGEEQFSREIIRVGSRGANAQPVFNVIADDWMDWNREQFNSEGRRASGGWAELRPATIAARGSAHPILQVTGALLAELTRRSNVTITDSWIHLQIPDEQDEYGRYHQGGTSLMAQRRPIEFTDMDRTDMTKRVQRYLITGEVR